MKFQLPVIITALCFSLSTAATSDAALISVTDAFGNSNISIEEGTPTVDVFVRITQDAADMGNTDIRIAALTFVVGDGGAALGGVDVVPITAVSHVNTGMGTNSSIWQPQLGNLTTSVGVPLPASSATIANVRVTTANTNVQFGPGVTGNVLAVLTLNTSALTAGQTDSIGTIGGFLLNPDNLGTPTLASFASGGGMLTSIPITAVTGTLMVTAVPEPGTFLLLSMGAVSVVAGRRYRRRRTQAKEST